VTLKRLSGACASAISDISGPRREAFEHAVEDGLRILRG
jgi:hypothetical protein